ncbi:MAG: prolyl oligopeptidase family serine peptidase [Chitinophagales bacterium]|nr:prolyl oligopeptidase family serine peptidase [Chitinophagales bacterium]
MRCVKLVMLIFSMAFLTGCPDFNNSPKVFRFEKTIVIDGILRSYTVVLPPRYYESDGFSLVIAMHGGGGSSTQFETTSKLTEKANTAGFIVVYPNGTGTIQTWNAGQCCGYAINNNVDDVKFIDMLIDKLTTDYKINEKRIYATGHSNGGMMCDRLACELSNKIAAIAPNGCTMVTSTPRNPSRPIPILHMHSKLDEHVPYQGGYGNGVTGIYCTPIDSVLQYWSEMNGCTKEKQLEDSNALFTSYKWFGCNNSSINYYLTNDGGHGWPGGLPGGPFSDIPSNAINANDLLWDFFSQYQLP